MSIYLPDIASDLREAGEAIEVIADFCQTGSHNRLADELTAAQIGPVLAILARTLLGHLDTLDQALSQAQPG